MTTSITSVQQLLIIYKVAMQEYFSGSEKATLHIKFLASSSLVSYLTVEYGSQNTVMLKEVIGNMHEYVNVRT